MHRSYHGRTLHLEMVEVVGLEPTVLSRLVKSQLPDLLGVTSIKHTQIFNDLLAPTSID